MPLSQLGFCPEIILSHASTFFRRCSGVVIFLSLAHEKVEIRGNAKPAYKTLRTAQTALQSKSMQSQGLHEKEQNPPKKNPQNRAKSPRIPAQSRGIVKIAKIHNLFINVCIQP